MSSRALHKIRLVLTPDATGGFVVTSPDLPELITEGDTADEAIANVRDALDAVRELYEDLKKPWPKSIAVSPDAGPVEFQALIDAA